MLTLNDVNRLSSRTSGVLPLSILLAPRCPDSYVPSSLQSSESGISINGALSSGIGNDIIERATSDLLDLGDRILVQSRQ